MQIDKRDFQSFTFQQSRSLTCFNAKNRPAPKLYTTILTFKEDKTVLPLIPKVLLIKNAEEVKKIYTQ